MNRILWICLTIAIFLGIIWQFFPLSDANARLQTLPMNGSTFNGNEVAVTDFEKDFFKRVNVLKRMYWVNDKRYFLYALDGTHNRHAVHDPTYCFRGGGWDVISSTPLVIPGGTARVYHLLKGTEKRNAIIWFSDGKTHFDSPIEYWVRATLRRLTLGLYSPEPVLIVIQPQGHENPNWKRFFRSFPEVLSL